MITKIVLLLRWETSQRLRLIPWQLVATIAILCAALLLAFRANDFLVWQLTKAIALACALNFFRLVSQTHKN